SVFPAWPNRESRLRCRFTIEEEAIEALKIRIVRRPSKDANKEPSLRLVGCDKGSSIENSDVARKRKPAKTEQQNPSEGKDAAGSGVQPPVIKEAKDDAGASNSPPAAK